MINSTQKFNDKLFLLALGIVQPASPAEIILFLRATFTEIRTWPSSEELDGLIDQMLDHVFIVGVRKGYFSLTKHGNDALTGRERRIRDKLRLSLLRQCHDVSLRLLEAGGKELGGDAPSSDTSMDTKEAPWPEPAGPVPSRQEATRHRAGRFWPRVAEQLSSVGLVPPASSITPLGSLRYCSYATLATLQEAAGNNGPERDMTLTQLALAIGVSPRLIALLLRKTALHYRAFVLPKKGGGSRTIHAPRFFLKTIQYWILDYVLWRLPVHPCCHAYMRRRSIATNAYLHVGKAYVANLDIKQYFDSISTNDVKRLVHANGVGPELASTVAKLTTLSSMLPQGAPTSPLISNAFLFEVDANIETTCSVLGVTYTRYADDITLSGDDKKSVHEAMRVVAEAIRSIGLHLNHEKTRLASIHSSQRVTGLVVNTGVRPPRGYRRNVRSEFHHALNDREPVTRKKIERLRGHLNYLRSFPELVNSSELQRYIQMLKTLELRVEDH